MNRPLVSPLNAKRLPGKFRTAFLLEQLRSRPPLVDHRSTTPFGVRVIGGPRQFKYNQPLRPGKGRERLGAVFSYSLIEAQA